MRPGDITFLTDGPDLWREAIDGAGSRDSLVHVLHAWKELFPDAWEARPLTHEEWLEWKRGLDMERGRGPYETIRSSKRRKFAGGEWCKRFGAILLPADLLTAGMIAEQYKVPWGCAYIRMKEAQVKP